MPRSLACLLGCFSFLSAASLESLPPPVPAYLALLPWGEAFKPNFSVSCRGFSYLAGPLSIPLGNQQVPSVWATTSFVGSNPDCAVRGLDPLPGTFFNYRDPNRPAEFLTRYSRVVFQQVWPGVDITYAFDGAQARLTFSIDSPARLSSLRFKFPPQPFPFRRYTDVRQWGLEAVARIRATERTFIGPLPVPIDVAPDASAPFTLPALPCGPVEIVMEADYASSSLGVGAADGSLHDSDGNRYQIFNGRVRKYSKAGEIIFETDLGDLVLTRFTFAANGQLLVVGDNPSRGPAIHRLDAQTGRRTSLITNGAGFLLAELPNGNLQVLVNTNSPNYQRIGPQRPDGCKPVAAPRFGTYCLFAVQVSSDGKIAASFSLPSTVGLPAAGGNGQMFIITASGVDKLDATGRTLASLQLSDAIGATVLSDEFGGIWVRSYFSSGRRFRYIPPGGTVPSRTLDAGYDAELVPLLGGNVVIYNAGNVRLSPDAILPAGCTSSSRTLTILDDAGAVQYSTYIPDHFSFPSSTHPATFQRRKLNWDRHSLDLDGAPVPATACRIDQYQRYLTQVAPGQVLQLRVRGVEDASPFQPNWQPGEDLPTSVRGWSIRFNGIPAPVHRLDQSAVTLSVPPQLAAQSPGVVRLTVWYLDRQLDEWYLELRPDVPAILEGSMTNNNPARPGQEVRLLVSGMAEPVRAMTGARQAVAITYFRQSPVHPAGIFELHLRMPDAPYPTDEIWVVTASGPYLLVPIRQ